MQRNLDGNLVTDVCVYKSLELTNNTHLIVTEINKASVYTTNVNTNEGFHHHVFVNAGNFHTTGSCFKVSHIILNS